MVRRCVKCGFAADTELRLPDAWETYLRTQQGFDSPRADSMSVPFCVACQRTVEEFLDPRTPDGERDLDQAVRAFLSDCEPDADRSD